MPVADDVHVVGNRGVDYGNGRIDGICGIGLIGIEHVARRVGSDCGPSHVGSPFLLDGLHGTGSIESSPITMPSERRAGQHHRVAIRVEQGRPLYAERLYEDGIDGFAFSHRRLLFRL